MKVLIVGALKPTGRLLPFVHEQAEALQTAGLEVDYFAITGKGIWGYLRCRKPLIQKIRAFQPDVIHAHFGLSGLFANLQRKVPVVTTYHGSDINVLRVRQFSRIAMRLSAYNIFVSKRSLFLISLEGRGYPHRNAPYALIPCGIDLDNFTPRTREEARVALGWGMDEKKVLFAGAFDNAVKNAPLAIEAINLLNNPKDEEEGVKLVEMKGYSRSEVANLFYAADALVMTSFTEGSPQVVKEAMACGCPIVSVDVGDVAERIAGLENCYIVEHTPKDIALKINTILQDSQRTNGRKRLLAMGLDNMQVAEKLIEIYNRVSR